MFSSLRSTLGVAIVCSIVSLSCEQYEYSSPGPGILEVRLKVVNSRGDLLPFSDSNFFPVTLRTLEARQPGNVRLEIYSDVNAIRRNDEGDMFNCLSTLGRDSAIVLGRAYAPPQEFPGLDVRISAGQFLIIYNGIFNNLIPVFEPPPPQSLQRLPKAGQPPFSIRVDEGRLTRVTVTFNLDSSLVQRTESFEYKPVFYVSSIQQF